VQSDKSGSLAIVIQPTYTALPYYYRYFELMQIEPVEKMSLSDIQYLERWSLRFGFVHVINKLAEVHALNGMEDAAVKDMITLQSCPDRYRNITTTGIPRVRLIQIQESCFKNACSKFSISCRKTTKFVRFDQMLSKYLIGLRFFDKFTSVIVMPLSTALHIS
jgi:hypothetical protein